MPPCSVAASRSGFDPGSWLADAGVSVPEPLSEHVSPKFSLLSRSKGGHLFTEGEASSAGKTLCSVETLATQCDRRVSGQTAKTDGASCFPLSLPSSSPSSCSGSPPACAPSLPLPLSNASSRSPSSAAPSSLSMSSLDLRDALKLLQHLAPPPPSAASSSASFPLLASPDTLSPSDLQPSAESSPSAPSSLVSVLRSGVSALSVFPQAADSRLAPPALGGVSSASVAALSPSLCAAASIPAVRGSDSSACSPPCGCTPAPPSSQPSVVERRDGALRRPAPVPRRDSTGGEEAAESEASRCDRRAPRLLSLPSSGLESRKGHSSPLSGFAASESAPPQCAEEDEHAQPVAATPALLRGNQREENSPSDSAPDERKRTRFRGAYGDVDRSAGLRCVGRFLLSLLPDPLFDPLAEREDAGVSCGDAKDRAQSPAQAGRERMREEASRGGACGGTKTGCKARGGRQLWRTEHRDRMPSTAEEKPLKCATRVLPDLNKRALQSILDAVAAYVNSRQAHADGGTREREAFSSIRHTGSKGGAELVSEARSCPPANSGVSVSCIRSSGARSGTSRGERQSAEDAFSGSSCSPASPRCAELSFFFSVLRQVHTATSPTPSSCGHSSASSPCASLRPSSSSWGLRSPSVSAPAALFFPQRRLHLCTVKALKALQGFHEWRDTVAELVAQWMMSCRYAFSPRSAEDEEERDLVLDEERLELAWQLICGDSDGLSCLLTQLARASQREESARRETTSLNQNGGGVRISATADLRTLAPAPAPRGVGRLSKARGGSPDGVGSPLEAEGAAGVEGPSSSSSTSLSSSSPSGASCDLQQASARAATCVFFHEKKRLLQSLLSLLFSPGATLASRSRAAALAAWVLCRGPRTEGSGFLLRHSCEEGEGGEGSTTRGDREEDERNALVHSVVAAASAQAPSVEWLLYAGARHPSLQTAEGAQLADAATRATTASQRRAERGQLCLRRCDGGENVWNRAARQQSEPGTRASDAPLPRARNFRAEGGVWVGLLELTEALVELLACAVVYVPVLAEAPAQGNKKTQREGERARADARVQRLLAGDTAEEETSGAGLIVSAEASRVLPAAETVCRVLRALKAPELLFACATELPFAVFSSSPFAPSAAAVASALCAAAPSPVAPQCLALGTVVRLLALLGPRGASSGPSPPSRSPSSQAPTPGFEDATSGAAREPSGAESLAAFSLAVSRLAAASLRRSAELLRIVFSREAEVTSAAAGEEGRARPGAAGNLRTTGRGDEAYFLSQEARDMCASLVREEGHEQSLWSNAAVFVGSVAPHVLLPRPSVYADSVAVLIEALGRFGHRQLLPGRFPSRSSALPPAAASASPESPSRASGWPVESPRTSGVFFSSRYLSKSLVLSLSLALRLPSGVRIEELEASQRDALRAVCDVAFRWLAAEIEDLRRAIERRGGDANESRGRAPRVRRGAEEEEALGAPEGGNEAPGRREDGNPPGDRGGHRKDDGVCARPNLIFGLAKAGESGVVEALLTALLDVWRLLHHVSAFEGEREAGRKAAEERAPVAERWSQFSRRRKGFRDVAQQREEYGTAGCDSCSESCGERAQPSRFGVSLSSSASPSPCSSLLPAVLLEALHRALEAGTLRLLRQGKERRGTKEGDEEWERSLLCLVDTLWRLTGIVCSGVFSAQKFVSCPLSLSGSSASCLPRRLVGAGGEGSQLLRACRDCLRSGFFPLLLFSLAKFPLSLPLAAPHPLLSALPPLVFAALQVQALQCEEEKTQPKPTHEEENADVEEIAVEEEEQGASKSERDFERRIPRGVEEEESRDTAEKEAPRVEHACAGQVREGGGVEASRGCEVLSLVSFSPSAVFFALHLLLVRCCRELLPEAVRASARGVAATAEDRIMLPSPCRHSVQSVARRRSRGWLTAKEAARGGRVISCAYEILLTALEALSTCISSSLLAGDDFYWDRVPGDSQQNSASAAWLLRLVLSPPSESTSAPRPLLRPLAVHFPARSRRARAWRLAEATAWASSAPRSERRADEGEGEAQRRRAAEAGRARKEAQSGGEGGDRTSGERSRPAWNVQDACAAATAHDRRDLLLGSWRLLFKAATIYPDLRLRVLRVAEESLVAFARSPLSRREASDRRSNQGEDEDEERSEKKTRTSRSTPGKGCEGSQGRTAEKNCSRAVEGGRRRAVEDACGVESREGFAESNAEVGALGEVVAAVLLEFFHTFPVQAEGQHASEEGMRKGLADAPNRLAAQLRERCCRLLQQRACFSDFDAPGGASGSGGVGLAEGLSEVSFPAPHSPRTATRDAPRQGCKEGGENGEDCDGLLLSWLQQEGEDEESLLLALARLTRLLASLSRSPADKAESRKHDSEEGEGEEKNAVHRGEGSDAVPRSQLRRLSRHLLAAYEQECLDRQQPASIVKPSVFVRTYAYAVLLFLSVFPR
ncbi:hypothetical protein BESB_023520 [Besnoitia besnoiti]|uniref:Uncharacterized protein n=1 Tax=Besnoitia besnoiti TaxID=94643 RepID=A0A2A9M8Z8_BESBE|nr:hypothetical protein BESB_023520 [Besnoitia besnoiti]PFH31860.1 hypothetical protein BESB_023520 [Besnoitia besnoiti]